MAPHVPARGRVIGVPVGGSASRRRVPVGSATSTRPGAKADSPHRLSSPHSVRSTGEIADFAVGSPKSVNPRSWSEVRCNTSTWGPTGMRIVKRVKTLEALEHPAHRRPGGGPMDLVGDGLVGGGQLLAHARSVLRWFPVWYPQGYPATGPVRLKRTWAAGKGDWRLS